MEEGRIITAAGVFAGIDMGLHLAARLSDRATAEAIQLVFEYDPQPPFDAGAVEKSSEPVRDRARRTIMRQLLGEKGPALVRALARPLTRG